MLVRVVQLVNRVCGVKLIMFCFLVLVCFAYSNDRCGSARKVWMLCLSLERIMATCES